MRVEDNLAAIAAHIAAIRAVDRYGVGTMEQAFAGYAALPPAREAARPWWEILWIGDDASVEEIQDAWRRLAKEHHPDAGGNPEFMAEINAARDAAMRARA
jgi:hypothetical protein